MQLSQQVAAAPYALYPSESQPHFFATRTLAAHTDNPYQVHFYLEGPPRCEEGAPPTRLLNPGNCRMPWELSFLPISWPPPPTHECLEEAPLLGGASTQQLTSPRVGILSPPSSPIFPQLPISALQISTPSRQPSGLFCQPCPCPGHSYPGEQAI